MIYLKIIIKHILISILLTLFSVFNKHESTYLTINVYCPININLKN